MKKPYAHTAGLHVISGISTLQSVEKAYILKSLFDKKLNQKVSFHHFM